MKLGIAIVISFLLTSPVRDGTTVRERHRLRAEK
jgi:hypothetical protein